MNVPLAVGLTQYQFKPFVLFKHAPWDQASNLKKNPAQFSEISNVKLAPIFFWQLPYVPKLSCQSVFFGQPLNHAPWNQIGSSFRHPITCDLDHAAPS